MVVGAIVQDLLIEGLKRIGSMGLNKALRVHKVDAALRGHASSNKALATAISDFETAVALRQGGLTDEMPCFLRELQNSGLATLIAEEAVSRRQSASTYDAFAALYASMFSSPPEGDCQRLFGSLRTAFRASLDALVQDPALAVLIDAAGKLSEARLADIERQLKALTEDRSPFFDYEHLSGFLQKVTRSLLNQYRYIRVETNKGGKLVDLQKVYIPSRLEPRSAAPATSDLPLRQRSGRVSRRTVSQSDIGFAAEKDASFGFRDLQIYLRRAVVLGDPGGGKSTLCQYLCYKTAREYCFNSSHPDISRNDADVKSTRIPIRVVLRHYETARTREPQLGLFDYIARDISSLGFANDAEVRYALSFALSLGKIVLAFDGLDEILNTAVRRDFVNIVTAFCDEYPLCPVIVTSRLIGYEDASLPDSFEEFELAKFNEREVFDYLKKFFRVIASLKPDDANRDAQKFISQTSGNAADLRQNPLMLGLMAFLFANKGDVPTNRPEIYQECAILIFEKWDQNRNIRAEIPSGFDLLHLFSEIAAKIYGNPDLEEGVSKAWIEGVNRTYFSGLFESKAKSIEASKQVSTFLTGRSWVLSEFGPDVYRFTHRTFLEYFFARHLNEEYETVGELLDVVLPKVFAKQWDVISHLALQMKAFRQQRRTSQAAGLLAQRLSDASLPPQDNVALASFASKALEYLMVPEVELRGLLHSILTAALAAANRGEFTAAGSVVAPCALAVADRREYVLCVLTERLAAVIERGERIRDIEFACGIASWNSSHIGRSWMSSSVSFPTALGDAILNKVEKVITKRARVDARYAQMAYEWYGKSLPELLARHGLAALLADGRPVEIIPPRPDPGMLVAFGNRIFPRDGARDRSSEWLLTLRAVGQCDDLSALTRLRADPISTVIYPPPELWSDSVRSLKSDVDAIRGFLICFLIHARITGHQTRSPGAGVPRPHLRSGPLSEFLDRVEKMLDALPDEQRARFQFWQLLYQNGGHLVAAFL